ncbi:Caleosin related protein-domain-containing protein [Lyophyllum atratum]|nr:Caleosin related protein-domain-containing protein [Lyophyllum atratum]
MTLPKHGRSGPPNGYTTGSNGFSNDYQTQSRKRDNAKAKDDGALKSHVAFFDQDGDGIIWPSDTYEGFRDLKFGVLFSLYAVLLIHASFSWITYGTLLPDPYFRLRVENMHKAKHGSDSECYTTTGAFDEDRFNDMFDRYSAEPHTHLTFSEGLSMIHGNRNVFDPFGWATAAFEWLTTYLVLWPQDGKMKKQDIRGVYDGNLFYEVSGRSKKTS